MSETIKWIVAVLLTLVGALLIIGEIWLLILFIEHPWTIAIALYFALVIYAVKYTFIDERLS